MNEPFFATKAQERIHSDIAHAIHRLLNELDIDPDLVPGTRFYHGEIVQPDDNTTILLVTWLQMQWLREHVFRFCRALMTSARSLLVPVKQPST